MELTYVSISYYRSITNAYKLDLSNLTVLIGKNNEGKTNVLKAIDLGMSILNNVELLQRRRIISKQMYEWHEDFPLSLQASKKLKNKSTTIRMDFQLNDAETNELNNIIHSNINGALSIFMEINESNAISITIPKRGKNASTLSSKLILIKRYCCNYIIILDYDSAGKNAANDIKQTLSVPEDKIRYFMRTRSGEFELEDLYHPNVYKDYFLANGLDISNQLFKDKSKKWSTRLENIGATMGRDLSSEQEDTFKQDIVSMIGAPVKDFVTEQGHELLEVLCSKVETDLKAMSLT